MFDKIDTIKKKEAMLEALKSSLGIVSKACQNTGVSRQTHYNWLKSDEKYKSDVDDICEIALDFAESQLHQLITDLNANAIFYYLNNKGKSRGYSRIPIENTEDKEIKVEINTPK